MVFYQNIKKDIIIYVSSIPKPMMPLVKIHLWALVHLKKIKKRYETALFFLIEELQKGMQWYVKQT